MSLSPPNYTPQPQVGWAWLWVNGELITDPQKPNELVRFVYERTHDNIGKVKFVLVDTDWTKIHSKLLSAPQGKVYVQFGYTEGDRKSNVYEAIVHRVIPSFIIDAIQLEVELLVSNAARLNTVKKRRAHPDTSLGETPAPIHEYVQRILKRVDPESSLDFDECDDEPKTFDSLDGSEKIHKCFVQNNMTDYQFIKTKLVPLARTKKEPHIGGYLFYYDPVSSTWHFHPPRYDRQQPIKTFVFMREAFSEVISFEVQHSGIPVNGAKGGERANITYVDQYNAQVDTLWADNKSLADKPRLALYKADFGGHIQTVDHAAYFTTFPVDNVETAKTMVNDKYIRGLWANVTATLTIAGDFIPELPGGPGTVIKVLVMDPHNRVHYTSGLYYVSGATDTIEGGTWITQYHLQREEVSR